MMQFFRRFGPPVFALAAVTVVIWMLVDLSGLTSTTGLPRNSDVGEVNGTSIDLRTYQAMVQQAVENRQRQGVALDAEQLEQVRNEVWEQIIQQRILETEYERHAITVSNDEVVDAIRSNPPTEILSQPEFQTDSQFDMQKYQRWLQSSVGQQYIPYLEAQAREEIRRSKLLRVITADVYLSDAALWQSYRDANDRATIEITPINPRIAVPDTAVQLTESEVRKYYDDHRKEFERPRTAYLSYVQLIRLPDASDSAAALARAQELRKEILDGAPFAEVASRESADSATREQGGNLGEWTRGSLDPEFEKAAFSIPLKTISQPVLSASGYHLIEVTARKGDKATARHILVRVEITGAHRDLLDAKADTLESLGAEQLDPAALDTVARALGLRVGKTNPVQEGGRVQIGVQTVPEAHIWAFRAKEGETSPVVEASYAYFLFRLDSLKPAGVASYEDARPAAEAAARLAKKRVRAAELAREVEQRMERGASLSEAAKPLGLQVQQFGPFTRINPPFPNATLIGAAFALDSGRTSGAIETEEGFYILRTLKRQKADSAEFVKTIDDLRFRELQAARQNRVRNYLTALRETAKIEDNRAEFFKTDAQLAQVGT